jgi:hypothetical protein
MGITVQQDEATIEFTQTIILDPHMHLSKHLTAILCTECIIT